MTVQVPNFTQEELKTLNQASVGLSDALKKARANGKEPGNPIEHMIDIILQDKRRAILESPLFYQLMFVAAGTSVIDVVRNIETIKQSYKEDNNV